MDANMDPSYNNNYFLKSYLEIIFSLFILSFMNEKL